MRNARKKAATAAWLAALVIAGMPAVAGPNLALRDPQPGALGTEARGIVPTEDVTPGAAPTPVGFGPEARLPDVGPLPALEPPALPPDELDGRRPDAADEEPEGLTIVPSVMSASTLAISSPETSTMALSSWSTSVMISTTALVPPASFASLAVVPIAGEAGRPPPKISYAVYDEPREDAGQRDLKVYRKPINRVLGTTVLFLILGLVFLRGRRDDESP